MIYKDDYVVAFRSLPVREIGKVISINLNDRDQRGYSVRFRILAGRGKGGISQIYSDYLEKITEAEYFKLALLAE